MATDIDSQAAEKNVPKQSVNKSVIINHLLLLRNFRSFTTSCSSITGND